MLQILHGPAIDSSRKKLLELRNNFKGEIITFEKGSDPKDISSALDTISLFGDEKLIIVEDPTEISNFQFPISNFSGQLIIWYSKEVDPKKIPQGFKVEFFPEAKEASIFPLLDLMGSKNPQAFVELQKTRPDGSDTQYLITMIIYLLRSLAVPPKNAPPFIQQKIAKQRLNFSAVEIVGLYRNVLENDYKIKMGLVEPTQAEFDILNKFLT